MGKLELKHSKPATRVLSFQPSTCLSRKMSLVSTTTAKTMAKTVNIEAAEEITLEHPSDPHHEAAGESDPQ